MFKITQACIILVALFITVWHDSMSANPIKSNPLIRHVDYDTSKDHHSFANSNDVILTHIRLDLDVDFEQKVLSGKASLNYKKLNKNASLLILDSKDLHIKKITSNGSAVPYEIKKADKNLGSAIEIELPNSLSTIDIHYTTSPSSSGLQWLTPEQTAGGEHPFLFSQAQAIHARSFIPLQDTPKVRVTYDATIRTPKALRAVMSASNDPDAALDGEFHFTMPQAIPSYLIAIAVGDLKFKPMGKRTGVYAEPSILEAASNEFEDTESMLIDTENRYGAYSWDRYDLLILPPSFPFGGMENPRLSFITPTVISGDKSLVSLIAHELAHSWSGNSVTNATWRDLWLNEGFTTYLTYRIMENTYGKERFKMEAVLGHESLFADIKTLSEPDELLTIDLRGRHPDDVFSNIPYEKGALFLREIEQKIGRSNFDAFLRNYFEHFSFQSITTNQFLDYINTHLLQQYPNQLSASRIQQWIYEAGIPENVLLIESDAFDKIDNIRLSWLSQKINASEIDTSNWTAHEWLYFLNNLPEKLTHSQLAQLDSTFRLTNTQNNEIAHSWLLICINNDYEPAFVRLHEYLISIGRNKLVHPLYQALSKTEKGKKIAKRAFDIAKPSYHPLTVKKNEKYVTE